MYILGKQSYITGIVGLLCVRVHSRKCLCQYNYSDLENRMSLVSRTSNVVAMRFEIFA